MRIGIDARIIPDSTGKTESEVASYTYNLIKNLASHDKENHYVLFFDSRVNKKNAEEFKSPNIKIVYFPFSTYKRYLSYAYSQFIVSGFIAKQKIDVFHACSGTMPLMYSGPTVLTLFELAPKGLDKTAQGKIIRKAKIIIAKNKEMKKKITDLYTVEADRIIPMEYCGTMESKNVSSDCIQKYLEIYTVARNSDIRDNYLLKLPLTAISTVTKPIKRILEPISKVVIYPIKKISRIKKKK